MACLMSCLPAAAMNTKTISIIVYGAADCYTLGARVNRQALVDELLKANRMGVGMTTA